MYFTCGFKIILLIFLIGCIASVSLGSQSDQLRACRLSDGPNTNCKVTRNFARVAIYEHDRIDKPTPLETLKANLDAFDHAAKLAADNGAQLIVFPEDGLFDGPNDWFESIIEEIPDPIGLPSIETHPCDNPELYNQSRIMIRLSCMAKANNIFIVANYGTKLTCQPGTKVGHQICPDKGKFDLNTDVVLNSDGYFIRRYHKWNLFIEAFDRPPYYNASAFGSEIGRVGIFTCFDILFKLPAKDLLEVEKVETIIFPTWWYDELPMLTALTTQEGWSLANNVNLLAANVHRPALGSAGSGIYSLTGDFITTSPHDIGSQLLIANIPIRISESHSSKYPWADFEPVRLMIKSEQPAQPYKHLNLKLKSMDSIMALGAVSGVHSLCNNEICCTLEYEITKDTYDPTFVNRLHLVVRDSLRNATFKWYEQVCFLAEIETLPINLLEPKKNIFASKSKFKFNSLKLNSTFNTKHVIPMALHDVDNLVDRKKRSFGCNSTLPYYQDNPMFSCRHNFNSSEPFSTIAFGLYGRVFERDQVDMNTTVIKKWSSLGLDNDDYV